MKDQAKWCSFGIGANIIGNFKSGFWEFWLGDYWTDQNSARMRLLNAGYSFKEAQAYLEILKKEASEA